jgi:hypothetical protein
MDLLLFFETTMNMKSHILKAMEGQLDRWKILIEGITEGQSSSADRPRNRSIPDIMAHLMAWQQISIARMEAAQHDREPEYPRWVITSGADWEENTDRTNTVIFDLFHGEPWTNVYENWWRGYRQLLSLGAKISERDLLDSSRYPWLSGYPLVMVLLGSYDHHQEHYRELLAWENG